MTTTSFPERPREATVTSSSFFEVLERRNVANHFAKVAVLYVASAWLLLQVIDVSSYLLPEP